MIFDNLEFDLNDLIQVSDSEEETIHEAVVDKVYDYCKEHKIDFDKVDFEYNVSISINILDIP